MRCVYDSDQLAIFREVGSTYPVVLNHGAVDALRDMITATGYETVVEVTLSYTAQQKPLMLKDLEVDFWINGLDMLISIDRGHLKIERISYEDELWYNSSIFYDRYASEPKEWDQRNFRDLLLSPIQKEADPEIPNVLEAEILLESLGTIVLSLEEVLGEPLFGTGD